MSETSNQYTTNAGVWNGWYWRFIGLTILVIVVLQAVAKIYFNYLIIESMPLAVLMVIYLVVPRTRERRLANVLVGVIVTFVLGLILEIALEPKDLASLKQFVYTNGFVIIFGLAMAYFFLKVTQWSEKRRIAAEEKRNRAVAPAKQVPAQRHHRKKRRKR